jgi:hypothetical protein
MGNGADSEMTALYRIMRGVREMKGFANPAAAAKSLDPLKPMAVPMRKKVNLLLPGRGS